MPGRPWLRVVWERMFATEDEADIAYERFGTWMTDPLVCDRLDGNTIRVYLDYQLMESCAQKAEADYEPPTLTTVCECGHVSMAHETDGSCRTCRTCDGFIRA